MTSVYTIVTRNHLHRARVVMNDVQRQMPEARRYIFLADEPEGYFAPAGENSTVILPADYAPPSHRHLAFALPAYGLCCVLKPFAASHLRRAHPQDIILYLDSDTRLLAPPDDLLALAGTTGIVLTPHVIDAQGTLPSAAPTLPSGVFNAGVFALGPREETDRFLAWWSELISDPRRATRDHLYDQVWLNLVPALFSEVRVLRHPGYNVAYWNIHERPLTHDDREGGWRVAGLPLVVHHFSGYDPAEPGELAPRSQRRAFPIGDVRWNRFAQTYATLLAEAGAGTCERWPYQFSRFKDGKPVTAAHRDYFTGHCWSRLPLASDPFDPALPAPAAGLRSIYNVDHPLTRMVRRVKAALRL